MEGGSDHGEDQKSADEPPAVVLPAEFNTKIQDDDDQNGD